LLQKKEKKNKKNDELCNRDVKSRRTNGHEILIGEMRNAYKILVGNLTRRVLLGDPDVNGRIILKWVLK
jgi:hypothetical protein